MKRSFILGLLVTVQAGAVWAQSNEKSPPDSLLRGGTIATIEETLTRCGTLTNVEYRYGEPEKSADKIQHDVTQPLSSGNDVMVAEDMRCRQCHGKCSADNLRCRSQCLNDSACMTHCEERSTKCTEMCKQIFQCQ